MALLGALYLPDATYAVATGHPLPAPEPDLAPFTDEDPEAHLPEEAKAPPVPEEALARMGLVPSQAFEDDPKTSRPTPLYRLAKG